MSEQQRLKIAVFIDFDNVEIGVKTTLGLHFDVGAVLEGIKERGEIITKIAYGDWKRAGDHGRAMAQHAIRLVQRVMTPGGDKNGADINLALDALEMAFTHDHINAFVIVGGDSDFITLVEKLKQYDKKVFVVGGRAFTSQVMQKNCTEFIAYENLVPDRRSAAAPARVAERGRPPGPAVPLDQALPIVKRALKVLADREVTPQLGLLKSTLLQLDSSFSERDYGVSTFRDFAEKLSERGLVTLKHAGRSTHVELVDTGSGSDETLEPERMVSATDAPLQGEAASPLDPDGSIDEEVAPVARGYAERELVPDEAGARGNGSGDGAVVLNERRDSPSPPPSRSPSTQVPQVPLSEGVAMVRRVLYEAPSPPRWPLYLRQMKQFLRAAQPDFDERKYGSIVDLMRACQRDEIVRMERDRQGGLRVFAGPAAYRAENPELAGWVPPDDKDVEAAEALAAASLAAVDAAAAESGFGEGPPALNVERYNLQPGADTVSDDDSDDDLEDTGGGNAQRSTNPFEESANGGNSPGQPAVGEPELPLQMPDSAAEPARTPAPAGDVRRSKRPVARMPTRRAKTVAPRTRTKPPSDDVTPPSDDSVGNRAPEPARARKTAKRPVRRGPVR